MRYSYRRPDAVVEGLEARRLLSVQAPALDLQFEGQHVGTLPDGSIAVSSDYVVQVVNFGIAWYAKGSTSGQVEPLGSIFGQGTRGDAQVVYDPYNQRFVVTAIGDTPTGDNAVVVAVSKTADPSQADGWWVAYVDTAGSVPGFSSVFLDQPRVAVGADALYICGDGFATGDQPTSMDPLFAVLKDPFYSGGTLQSSELLLNGSYWAPVQPYGTLPPGVGDFVVNATFADPNGVSHFDYQVVTEDPTQQTPTARFGLGFGFPQDVVEPPSTGPVFDGADPNFPNTPNYLLSTNLSNGGNHLTYTHSPVWRNGSLYYAYTNSPGPNDPGYQANGEQATVLWERLSTDASPWTVSDWGWEYGEDIPPAMTGVAPPYRTRTSYPSIAVNARGDMLLNFVADGPNIYAGAYYAVHRVNDPPHTIGPSVALAVGQGVYPANLTGGRWGDYSGAAVDPSDDNTFWIENLYAESSSGNIVIGTRIGELSNNLVVAGDDYGLPPTDAIAIARDAVNTSLLDINVNGTREFQGEFAAINQITVNSLTGNDVLTVDTTYGSPVPSGGFTYDGGSGFNTLKIIGSGSVNNVASMDALSFTINGSTMKYVNVESIEFDGGAGNDTLTISANVPLGPSFHGGTGADTLNVNAGTFAPPGDAGAFCSALTINDNSKVQFNATQHLAGLTIGAGDVAFMVPGVTANQNTLNVASLSIASTGKLDLANNSLAVSYAAGASPASTIRSYLVSGYAAGAWNGYGIQTSLGNSSTLALGYRDEADGIVGGPSSNVVLVMFTVYGDANLDGHVNSSDQTLLNTYLGMSSGALWDEGDFNYDGQVSAADSSLLTANLDPVYSGGAGAITVAGTSGNDAITIKLDASNPSLLDTIVNGVQTQTTFSSVTQIIVNGLGGIDTLTVDATNGSPIPTNGIDFNRSTGTGKLIIKGANATNTASVTSSAFTLNGGTIAYGTAQSVEFDGGSGNDTLTIPSLLPFSPIFNPGTGSGSDTLNVNAGTYNFAADAAIDTSSLTVNDNANVIFDLGRQIAGLNIGAGNIATLLVNAAPDTQKLTLGSLSIASTGILNLGNDEMMLNYGTNADPVSAIRSYLVSGYNGGAWNGYGIQTSIGDNARFALGYADGADGVVAGLSSTSILVMFTRYGDVDLSGQVLQPDLTLLSAHYNGSGASWDQGDMNYDGTVTFSDLLILAQNYGGTP